MHGPWQPHPDGGGRRQPTDLVVMEGFSFGSPQGATEAGGLGWAIRIALHEAEVIELEWLCTHCGAAGEVSELIEG